MKALIAFIVMAAVILTLIEINERIKKRKKTDMQEPQEEKDCAEPSCAECELMDVCEKEEKKNERVKE